MTRLSMTLPIAMFSLCSLARAAVAADEEKFVFETWSKQKVEAFRGSFTVPEIRGAEDSRMIPIKYVRLPATDDKVGPPIVYLSGGPGGSGIQAINYRYQMFMAMREYGDVIALDQRGTGASNIVPECQSRQVVPTTTEVSDREFVAHHREALVNQDAAFVAIAKAPAGMINAWAGKRGWSQIALISGSDLLTRQITNAKVNPMICSIR